MRLRRLPTIACLLILAAGSQGGSLTLGARYKDESNGFQIYPPRKWEQVPTKFQQVALIGKWSGRAKRGAFAPELHVLRFLKVQSAGGELTPEEALKGGIPGYGSVLRSQPKDVWEYADRIAKRFGGADVHEEDPELRMTSRKFKAHYKILVQKQRGSAGGRNREAARRQIMIVAAQIDTVEESDSSFGVAFFCTVADRKDMLPTFRRSIQRFKILEEDEEDEEGEASDADIFVDSTKKPEAWRQARKRKLIPGWAAVDTANYLIVYNKEVKRPLLKKIAKHIEAIRAQIYENLFPPAREVKAISVVRVCKDKAEYHRYGGPGGSAGYWSRGDEELVFYQDKSNKKDSLRVLYHEAFHLYIHYAVGDVAPHSWFNEGHGDYFAGHDYVGKKFKAKPFRWRTGIIATAIGSKTYVPLDRFLKYTQGEYYANPGLCYAQGWSLVYFLREVERRKIKKYKQYWGLLDRYFEAIKRNVKSVKEQGLAGLNRPPPKPDEGGGEGVEGETPADEAVPGSKLPRLPGLERPFPGEHPLAGAGEPEGLAEGNGERRTVAGPRITSVRTALDAAVDHSFQGIDLKKLEKHWIEFSK
jgi:hypothetical protein